MKKILVVGLLVLFGLTGCLKAIPQDTEGPYTIDHTGEFPEGRYEINTHSYYGVGYIFDLDDSLEFEGLDVYVVHNEMELALMLAIHIDRMAIDFYYVEDKALDYDKVDLYLNALLVNEVDIDYGEVDVPETNPSATYLTYGFTYEFPRTAKVENTIDEWTYDLKSSFYSDRDKAEFVLMTMLDSVVYDDAALDDEARIDDGFTALGVFQDGQAVCNGYSQAYMGLLKDLDVPAIMVGSDADDHAWNLVYAESEWSYVDSTWEDDTYADTDVWYYFLIDRETLEEDHHWDSGWGDTLNGDDYEALAYYVFPQTRNDSN